MKFYKNKKRSAASKALYKWYYDLKKTLKCSRCPEHDPVCLEFHHKNPKLKFKAVSALVADGFPKAVIKKEIKKCSILCANCHRKYHNRHF